jgi:hypothetical protein
MRLEIPKRYRRRYSEHADAPGGLSLARVKTLAHRDTGRHDSILPKGVGGRDLYLDFFAHTHDPGILIPADCVNN